MRQTLAIFAHCYNIFHQSFYMETYNFNEIVNRRGTNSYKWDVSDKENFLPMWVADMDFRTLPFIIERLQQRVAHGVFGYTAVPDSYYDAITNWFVHRHNWLMQKEWIIYTSGVVPAISAIIKAMTQTGDKVLVQTPVYNCFFSSIKNNGCEVLCNELIYEDGTYRIDFDDLEQKAADPKTTVIILCNPHNPAGRVWTRDELVRIGEICLKNDVFVIADEIHCELVMPGHRYTPFASISPEILDNCAVCTSPSKAFNIAGLQIANITIANDKIRRKVDRAININEVCDVNPFGVEALQAAYSSKGAEWLDQLNAYLYDNYLCLCEFFENNLPQFPVTKLEGTYLVWVDCSVLGKPSNELCGELLQAQGLYLNEGTMYGTSGIDFVRINIACPRAVLIEGLQRFKNYVVY